MSSQYGRGGGGGGSHPRAAASPRRPALARASARHGRGVLRERPVAAPRTRGLFGAPPASRTNRTRLVPPPVLNGHASSQPPY